jgi:hypothetical protein
MVCVCMCVCVCVCVCVCMFAYNSRTDKLTCTKLGMFIPWNEEEISERTELWKSVLGSKPGEGVFCVL